MRISIPIFLSVLSFLSCSRENESFGTHGRRTMGEPVGYPISFNAACDTLEYEVTRATPVTSLSSFSVHCFTGTPGVSELPVFVRTFTADDDIYTGHVYWPVIDENYRFYASNVTVVPKTSGAVVNAVNNVDVVCAVCHSPVFRQTNALTFSHIFGRLGKVTVRAPGRYAVSGLSISLVPRTGGTYSLLAGNGRNDGTGWSAVSSGSVVTIATSVGETAATDLYLVPGVYEITATYTLSVSNYVKTFTRKADVAVYAGKINAVSTTLPEGDAEDIVFTVSVEDWTVTGVVSDFS